MKKLLTFILGASITLGISFTQATEYSQELQDAYNRAYENGIITETSIDNVGMFDQLTNMELARIISKYATNIVGLEPDTTKTCNFTDIDSVQGEMHDYIIKSCQLGLMPGNITGTTFDPYEYTNKAVFGTALSRVLWGSQNEGGNPYYTRHLEALKAAGIMDQIDNAEDTAQLKGYTLLMLMRNAESYNNITTTDFGTISIANPDDPSEGITIMDRNLGATSNDTNSSDSYGYYYQRGNNFGFSQNPMTSSGKVSRNSSYNNGYYNKIFRTTGRDYWTDQSHDGLWGGVGDNKNNGWGLTSNNSITGRQGPCPDGYHIPSAGERGLLVKYRKNTYNKNVVLNGNHGQYNFTGKTATKNFLNYFKLPLAGGLNSYDATLESQNEDGIYWSSSANNDNEGYAEHLSIIYSSLVRDSNLEQEYLLSKVYATAASPRTEGLPVRCFKNTYEPIDCKDPTIALACLDPENEELYKECPAVCREKNLTNNITGAIEFPNKETYRHTVFKGKYTTNNRTINLSDFTIIGKNNPLEGNNNIKFYLIIGSEEYEVSRNNTVQNINIQIKSGETVNINIEAEIEAHNTTTHDAIYSFELLGNDDNDYELLKFNGDLTPIRIADRDILTIGNEFEIQIAPEEDTIHLMGRNQNIASFKLKPTNGTDGYLSNIVLEGWEDETNTHINLGDSIELKIDGNIIEDPEITEDNKFLYEIDDEIPNEGVDVNITVKEPVDGSIFISIYAINDQYSRNEAGISFPRKTFGKRFEPALVYITKQENKGNHTKFTLGIDKFNEKYSIDYICITTGSTSTGTCLMGENSDNGPFENGYTFIVNNSNSDQPINYIRYYVKNSDEPRGETITIGRENYPDYFKTGNGDSRKIFARKSSTGGGGGGGGGSSTKTDKTDTTIEKAKTEITEDKENKENKENNTTNKKQDNITATNSVTTKESKKYDNGNPTEVLSNGYTREMNNAYKFAHDNGITTTKNIEKAKMNSPLTRIQMAKMLSNYAINVLGKEPDVSKGTVKFNDVTDKQNKNYDNAVTLAYQLGIMGQNIKNNNFRPNDEVTRAEFATALSRMLYGTNDGQGNAKYYETHMKKLYNEGIITKDNPDIKEKRGYVMIMLMRTAE